MTNSGMGPIERVSVKALVIWGAGLTAYVFAVFARTSLSAAAVDAAVRFHASAASLSLFTVLQLAVYAAMQIPAGTTVDRIGPRKAIAIGSLLIGLGQIAIAFAGGVPTAIVARVLVGSGDAFIFLSVLRLVPAWFPARHVALVTQLTGMAGHLGQLLSLGPLVAVMHTRGWTAAFLGAGSLTLLVGAVALIAVRDGHQHRIVPADDLAPGLAAAASLLPAGPRPTYDDGNALVRTWRNPGTRMGFWVHFTTPFSSYAFALLWGFAYMTKAEHLAAPAALGVLRAFVFGCLVFGPLLGVLSNRFPNRRVRIAACLVVVQAVTWVVVLAWPDDAPGLLLYVLAVVLATGPPASLIGFDLCRTTNPLSTMGLAAGMVNVGGFTSTLTTVLAVGVALDLLGEGTPDLFTDRGFTIAWLVQVPILLVGFVMLGRTAPAHRAYLRQNRP